MTSSEKALIFFGILLYFLLAIFSYAYVDLNLTLNQSRLALSFISSLQTLGYYNRPLSTTFFILLIIFLFSFFIVNLILASKNKLTIKYIFTITVLLTAILVFAYPFLSSDIFNYMFDAKILLHYHLSPYTHKALDFPTDDWIRFMRWTHRYSPYGPLWLVYSLIPAALGLGKFILTLFFFKIFIGIFHLINSFLIYKITQNNKSKNPLFSTAFYALNPLFLIEGIANSHNDIVLAAFILGSIYFLSNNKRKSYAAGSIILGTFLKYVPILNLSWIIIGYFYKMSQKSFIFLNLLTLAVFTIIFSTFKITVPFISSGATQVQFQPWYLFWAIPIVALIGNRRLAFISIAICLGAMLRYIPYLYNGDWSQPGTIRFMEVITFLPAIILFPLFILHKFVRK